MNQLTIVQSKRVFVLGPSHHSYTTKCCLTAQDEYETPLGNIRIDKEGIAQFVICVAAHGVSEAPRFQEGLLAKLVKAPP